MSWEPVEGLSRVTFGTDNIRHVLYEPQWKEVCSDTVYVMQSSFQVPSVFAHEWSDVRGTELVQVRLVSDRLQITSVCLGQRLPLFVAKSPLLLLLQLSVEPIKVSLLLI